MHGVRFPTLHAVTLIYVARLRPLSTPQLKKKICYTNRVRCDVMRIGNSAARAIDHG